MAFISFLKNFCNPKLARKKLRVDTPILLLPNLMVDKKKEQSLDDAHENIDKSDVKTDNKLDETHSKKIVPKANPLTISLILREKELEEAAKNAELHPENSEIKEIENVIDSSDIELIECNDDGTPKKDEKPNDEDDSKPKVVSFRKPRTTPVPVIVNGREFTDDSYTKMYRYTSSTSEYLDSVEFAINYLKVQARFNQVPLFARFLRELVEYLGPFPCSHSSSESILLHSIQTAANMIIVAKQKSYLFKDYDESCIAFVLMFLAISHEVNFLVIHEISSFPPIMKKYNPYEFSIKDYGAYTRTRALTVKYRDNKLPYETIFNYGKSIFKSSYSDLLRLLESKDHKTLISDLVSYDSSKTIYKVFFTGHDIACGFKNINSVNFMEPLRPRFPGVEHTPSNWYEDERFKGELAIYDKEIIEKCNVHDQVDMAYCLSQKWALDLINLHNRIYFKEAPTIHYALEQAKEIALEKKVIDDERAKLDKLALDLYAKEDELKEHRAMVQEQVDALDEIDKQKYSEFNFYPFAPFDKTENLSPKALAIDTSDVKAEVIFKYDEMDSTAVPSYSSTHGAKSVGAKTSSQRKIKATDNPSRGTSDDEFMLDDGNSKGVKKPVKERKKSSIKDKIHLLKDIPNPGTPEWEQRFGKDGIKSNLNSLNASSDGTKDSSNLNKSKDSDSLVQYDLFANLEMEDKSEKTNTQDKKKIVKSDEEKSKENLDVKEGIEPKLSTNRAHTAILSDDLVFNGTLTGKDEQSSVKGHKLLGELIYKYCLDNSISSISEQNSTDIESVVIYKKLMKKILQLSENSNEIKTGLKTRVSRYRQVLDIVDGFVKEGSFALDFELSKALKHADTFDEMYQLLLVCVYSAQKDPVTNKICIRYMEHFIDAEVKKYKLLATS